MKKSLLSLALAALATTAFATTVYDSKDVNFTVYGSVSAEASNTVAKTQTLIKENGFVPFLVEGKKAYSYTGKFGFKTKYENEEGFLVAFDAKAQVALKPEDSRLHVFTLKDKTVTDNVKYVHKNGQPVVLELKKAELTLGHPLFGTLKAGNTNTVVNDFAGTSLNSLEVKNGVAGPTSAKKVLNYTLPTFTDNLTLAYSFANDYTNEVDKFPVNYSRNNAFLATYSDMGVTFGVGASFENTYTNNETFAKTFDTHSRAKTAHTFVKFENMPYVEGLATTVGYDFTQTKLYSMNKTVAKTHEQFGFVDVSYNVFDVVTPYVGFGFNHLRGNLYYTTPVTFTAKDTMSTYAGLSAAYTLVDDVKVSAYVEGKWEKSKSRMNTVETVNRFVTYNRGFALGATLSF